eukprot:CAMPEP_0173445102 /NCGR_PEP_ID=MMETSP1357-20121228/33601_1 /TAXON_ID=77926 /ORGANISM="Hemiselmis rufescens, Strain PCC563" /LENGTH=94 /DNA_ID=CAMNT_0014411235 /DNA_START=135 /DNA_END=415 /DNA_ORIENTATION=+
MAPPRRLASQGKGRKDAVGSLSNKRGQRVSQDSSSDDEGPPGANSRPVHGAAPHTEASVSGSLASSATPLSNAEWLMSAAPPSPGQQAQYQSLP